MFKKGDLGAIGKTTGGKKMPPPVNGGRVTRGTA